ncbi:hypothetical protein F5X99DRAFT_397574, partial [Biscogniauxia marginata]
IWCSLTGKSWLLSGFLDVDGFFFVLLVSWYLECGLGSRCNRVFVITKVVALVTLYALNYRAEVTILDNS